MRWTKQAKFDVAMRQLETTREEAAFERIRILVSEEDRRWRFFSEQGPILNYWPSTGRCQIIGESEAMTCLSPQVAVRIAIKAKQQQEESNVAERTS